MKAMEGPPGPDEGRSYASSGYPWAQKKGGKKAFLQKMAEAAKVRPHAHRSMGTQGHT